MLRGKTLFKHFSSKSKKNNVLATHTILEQLENSSKIYAQKDAVHAVEQEHLKLTLAQILQFGRTFSNGLMDFNYKKKDKLLLLLNNSLESLVIQTASLMCGVTLCTIDPKKVTNLEDLKDIMDSTQCRGIIYQPKMYGVHYTAIVEQLVQQELTTPHEFARIVQGSSPIFKSKRFPHLTHVITTGQYDSPGVCRYVDLQVDEYPKYLINERLDMINAEKEMVHSIAYDSPTSKGKAKTAKELQEDIQQLIEKLKFSSEESTCLTSQPAAEGISTGALAAMIQHSQLILPSLELNQEAIDKHAQLNNCTIIGSSSDDFKRK